MLPAQFRLKLPPKWNRNYPDIKVNTTLFKIIAKNNEEGINPKVGFIISTKVGKAVLRNRTRRKLEGLLLPILKDSKSKLEVVFIVYPTCVKSSDEEISSQINQALSKIHLK